MLAAAWLRPDPLGELKRSSTLPNRSQRGWDGKGKGEDGWEKTRRERGDRKGKKGERRRRSIRGICLHQIRGYTV